MLTIAVAKMIYSSHSHQHLVPKLQDMALSFVPVLNSACLAHVLIGRRK
jgi:hypothetical protein